MRPQHADSPSTVCVSAPEWIGADLFRVTAPVHLPLGPEASIAVAANTLVPIGGAHIGLGAADGRTRAFWSELAVAVLLGHSAVLGHLWHWSGLPVGFALHAVWDLLHHRKSLLARIPGWHVPLCVVYDPIAAAFLIVLCGIGM